VDRLTPARAEEIASHAAGLSRFRPERATSDTPMTDRLIGIARWLHGDRQ
jgi:hypothetical protein